MRFFRSITTLLALSMFVWMASSATALAEDATQKALFINSSDLRWGNAPPSLPKGAQMSVLLGDPTQAGPFVIRFKAPKNFKIPPHYHSRAETLTVLSGTLYLGDGEKLDPTIAHAMKVGGFHYLPAKTTHFAFTKKPAVVEIHGEGPFDIIYINPEDDPQKARRE